MSSISIECVCVDDRDRPEIIPTTKWVVRGEKYNITHIFVMMQQKKIQGCELAEFDISMHIPYNCYRLSRFAFKKEDIAKLTEMMKDGSDLNDVDFDPEEMLRLIPVIENSKYFDK